MPLNAPDNYIIVPPSFATISSGNAINLWLTLKFKRMEALFHGALRSQSILPLLPLLVVITDPRWEALSPLTPTNLSPTLTEGSQRLTFLVELEKPSVGVSTLLFYGYGSWDKSLHFFPRSVSSQIK